jgi:hypothetical protein
MSFGIRPGKATCAGIVGIMLVLPSSIWRGSDAAPARPRVRIVRPVAHDAGRESPRSNISTGTFVHTRERGSR